MKRVKKIFTKRLVSVIAAAAMVVQTFCAPVGMQTVQADTPTSVIGELINESYTPKLKPAKDTGSGLVHPGLGVNEELLLNLQTQVRSGQEPWKTYFEDMLLSGSASKTITIKKNGTDYNNGNFKDDAVTAYTQAVLYWVTGDNVYRKNAISIFRAWAELEKCSDFNESFIHAGIPFNRMCIAAEIIRYSDYQVTGDYTETDLDWTEEDIQKFIDNLLNPAVETFFSGNGHFMNQHLYCTIGAMSCYLFMDNKAGYDKTVEWFTVNAEAENQGRNGSIKQLFREVTHRDVKGGKVGEGTPLDSPVIQHVEMGRDQAHGCGDLTNAAILGRMMLSQGTKVDPVNGTVSEEPTAVDCYEFLDNRILKTADFFFEYMLGYDADWVPVPFSIAEDGTILGMYNQFSAEYRGRYQTINFWDLYSYYSYLYDGEDVDLENDYPFLHEGFMKKVPSNDLTGGSKRINWENKDGGGDFWIFLPAAAAEDAEMWLAEEQVDYKVEVEDRGSMVTNKEAMELGKDGDVEYVRFNPSNEKTELAMVSSNAPTQTVAFRIRTNGAAKLSVSYGVSGSVYLPDTKGEWKYVTLTCSNTQGFGDLYYLSVSDIAEGGYVDIDAIHIKPAEKNVDVLNFEGGNEDINLATYANAPVSIEFVAADSVANQTISYNGIELPDGAAVNAETGTFEWTPAQTGEYSFYVEAKANETSVVKRVVINVVGGRNDAIETAIANVQDKELYTSETWKNYEEVLAATNAMVGDGNVTDADFTAQMQLLSQAIADLYLVSAPLQDDQLATDPSLDYMNMVVDCTVDDAHKWTDSVLNHAGNNGMRYHILDFGPDFKVSATKFGFMARAGFANRLAGAQVFGSNDKKEWVQLTAGEAKYVTEYHEVDVADGKETGKYRYLKIQQTNVYPDELDGTTTTILEFSEFRIFGTRYETGNMIKSISMSSDQNVGGRIKMGDTVTLDITTKGEIENVSVEIQGNEAEVKNVDGTTWKATAVMESGSKTGNLEIQVEYTKVGGEAGDPFYETTDGSSLFLVNSDIFIDAGLLAANLTATNGSWDGKATAEQCAALLFDGDVSTFGDLKNAEGDYYVVDFGEGVTVSLQEVMFMPRSTQQNHADRLNGAVVYGTNDDLTNDATGASANWTKLTNEVSGATMNVWTQVSDMLDDGSYRYFKIAGAEQGDIAEVEFYGTYTADPALIANKITSMADQQPSKSKLVYPSVPTGYTVSVASTSNEDVVALDGTINTPKDDTTVTLTLKVTSEANPELSATTGNIEVVIKGIASLISGIDLPAKGATQLTLPTVPAGYTVSVWKSTDEKVVALDNGAITLPDYTTVVDVILKLVREDGTEAECGPYTVLIYGKNESGKIDVLSIGDAIASTGAKCDLLFDGSISGDGYWEEAGVGSYYTVDFGDLPAIIEKVRFYPRSTKSDHAARLNNTHILGSNDGINWEQITEKVTGAVMNEWVEMTAEDFLAYGAYKQLRIAGADRGCIGEVEFYGLFDTDAEGLAAAITSIPDVVATDDTIVMPVVPAGYEISIETSDNENVIKKDGTVNIPKEDTVVTLTFKVEGFGGEGITGAVKVNVQGMVGLVSALKMPAADATTLTLPDVPSGYTLTIADSTKPDVIDTEGKITTPALDTLVDITLKLSRDGGDEVTIPAQTIMVYGTTKNAPIRIYDFATITIPSGVTGDASIKNMFDKDAATFAEISKDREYIIDFGENNTVLLDLVRMLPRTDSNWDRMNGAKVSGSNDGTNWVVLTDAVSGAAANTWKEFAAESFYAYDEYRYFMISGMKLGQFAELEFYGLYNGAVMPTPTPVATATPEPVATATPEPVATATPEPVATATPEPAATATPEPVATATPEPVATATPEPAATATPEPAATATPEPAATATPKPVATATPEPVATATPEPAATATPEPVATATPEPAATATPEPAATATPVPTTAPTQAPEPTAAPVANGWDIVDGKKLWYENGVLQGTEGRGKEIYDSTTDAWYWLDSVLGGAVATNKDVYQESEAGPWADRADGTGKWVRYDENGYVSKGWQETDEGNYYFDQIYGTMAKVCATIEGVEYYFDEATGVLLETIGEVPENGWKEINGNLFWYEGSMRQGFKVDDSYRGKEVYDPETDAWYWLDNVLGGAKAVSKDVYQDSFSAYPDQPDGTGKWVRYDENGRMIKGWQYTDAGTYYFEEVTGSMAKGTVTIEGVEYHFDVATGILQQ